MPHISMSPLPSPFRFTPQAAAARAPEIVAVVTHFGQKVASIEGGRYDNKIC